MDSHEIENLKSESKAAFLPFGFRGIARFGYARNVFLFSIELTVVLFFSLCVLWFVCGNCFCCIAFYILFFIFVVSFLCVLYGL